MARPRKTKQAEFPEEPATIWANRFAYCRWRFFLRYSDAPTDRLVAQRTKIKENTVSNLKRSQGPPRDLASHDPLAAFFDVSTDWLIYGKGEAPEPFLWEHWQVARAAGARRAKTERDDVLDDMRALSEGGGTSHHAKIAHGRRRKRAGENGHG